MPLLVAAGRYASLQNAASTRQNSKNMWSTVITIIASVVAFSIVYHRFWYPDRIREVIELSQDSLVWPVP